STGEALGDTAGGTPCDVITLFIVAVLGAPAVEGFGGDTPGIIVLIRDGGIVIFSLDQTAKGVIAEGGGAERAAGEVGFRIQQLGFVLAEAVTFHIHFFSSFMILLKVKPYLSGMSQSPCLQLI
ncbi:hypothetical protein, partial [Lelliottia aquatilis]|uniref:hypothetical protein n=1 Tax=Lelliottia aquatilis TaxID=2080838 RepID=UPI0020C6E258